MNNRKCHSNFQINSMIRQMTRLHIFLDLTLKKYLPKNEGNGVIQSFYKRSPELTSLDTPTRDEDRNLKTS